MLQPMEYTKLNIEGAYLFEPVPLKDKRGEFREEYNSYDFWELGITDVFTQTKYSKSYKNVIRGLHYQSGIYAQAKLIKCTHGKIIDVLVDVRKKSKTFGSHIAIELDRNKIIFAPPGLAHGFSVLTETAGVLYSCSKTYSPKHECGIRYDDSSLRIDWKIKKPIVSDKDLLWPKFVPY